MAVTSTVKKISVSLKLNNGTTDTGQVKTVNVSLGSLNKSHYDADKVMNIVNAMTPCLSKTLLTVEKTQVETLVAA